MSYRKILIINLGGIGDILLSIPALRALRKLYPQAEINMLASARVYEIIKNFSFIDKLFTFDIGYGGVIPLFKMLKNLKILLTLRKKKFDLAINMRTLVSERSAKKIKILFNIIKPKTKVGRDTDGRGHFFGIKIPETDKGKKYEMEYDIDTVMALGGEVVDRRIDFEIGEEVEKNVNNLLGKDGIGQRDTLVGIHPGGMPSRRWPLENFSRVIDEIHKKESSKFIVTGGKDEIGLINKLNEITNTKIIDITDRLSIKELGAVIKRCNLYISNDTGPMHIAAILKTPLIAIFGPGDIIRYDPRNISNKAMVLYQKLECAPCEKVQCNDLKCLKAISPEEVIEAGLKVLKESR